MSILGNNKQLYLLQTLVVLTIRGIAYENGLSSSGRLEFQTAFVVLVVMFGLLLFIVLLWRIRKNWRQYWLVLLGLAFVIGFLAIRAASFNDVDYPLSQWRVDGHLRMKYVVELGGVLMVGARDYYSRIKRKIVSTASHRVRRGRNKKYKHPLAMHSEMSWRQNNILSG